MLPQKAWQKTTWGFRWTSNATMALSLQLAGDELVAFEVHAFSCCTSSCVCSHDLLFFVFTGIFAAFIPEDVVGEMTSIGTLFAFILVCAGVWIMRSRRPDLERGFRVPALPVVATLGIVVCGAMIYGLGWTNWARLFVWLLIGLFFYFGYGRRHSRIDEATPY